MQNKHKIMYGLTLFFNATQLANACLPNDKNKKYSIISQPLIMKNEIVVNKRGLELFILLQAKLSHAKRELSFNLIQDPHANTFLYYQSLPFTVFVETGLINSQECFDAIIQYPITDKLKYVVLEQLAEYVLNY